MSSKPVLIGISYSPWTAKARWALDHHQIAYRYREHILMVGMPELRFRTGKWLSGDLTVPALCAKDGVWLDSWKIALHAEEIGSGKPLFGSADELAAIERFNGWSETAVDAMRSLLTRRIPLDPEARSEALAPIAPRFAHGMLSGVVKLGTRYIANQFGVGQELSDEHFLTEIHKVCIGLRDALAASGGRYLLGDRRGFSYADVVMAAALQGLKPVEHPSLKLGPATRRAWGTPALAAEFPDLLAWRDRMYGEHRPTRV